MSWIPKDVPLKTLRQLLATLEDKRILLQSNIKYHIEEANRCEKECAALNELIEVYKKDIQFLQRWPENQRNY